MIVKISTMIDQLELAKKDCGDIECVIEVMYDDVVCIMPCGELSYDVREGYGESIAFLE
jgi:hypothetical protein